MKYLVGGSLPAIVAPLVCALPSRSAASMNGNVTAWLSALLMLGKSIITVS